MICQILYYICIMNPVNKPVINESNVGVNPFAFNLVIPVRNLEFVNQYKKEEEVLLPVVHEVEVTSYTKCYISSERRLIKSNLSLRAKELFLWLCDELESGKDYVWINKERYLTENNISSINTYKKSINEMIRYGFIANTAIRDVYWINPDFLFRGDRIKKYPNNIELKN